MHKDIIAFLKSIDKKEYAQYFLETPTSKNLGEPLPSPRTWEIVSNILDMENGMSNSIKFEMVAGAVGKRCASKFFLFRNSTKNKIGIISIDDLLNLYDGNDAMLNNIDDNTLNNIVDQLINILLTYKSIHDLTNVYQNAVNSIGKFTRYLCHNRKSLLIKIVSAVNPEISDLFVKVITEFDSYASKEVSIISMIADIINKK